jgi:glutamate-1-semialdehyde 2,1-aminomutase
VLPLNDKEALRKTFQYHKKDIACVIIEPVPANNGLLLQSRPFLEFLSDICAANGVMLIFDEVISGFRLGFTGATGYYNINPDIITFGKVIGGGLPVGAYGAKAEVMKHISPDGNVYQAGTLSGNPVAMAGGIAQLKECLKKGFYKDLEKKTKRLVDGIMKDIKPGAPFKIFHIGSIFWPAFTNRKTISAASEIDAKSMDKFKILHAELLERGVYLGPSGYEVGFVSSAHTNKDIDKTIKAFKEALKIALK